MKVKLYFLVLFVILSSIAFTNPVMAVDDDAISIEEIEEVVVSDPPEIVIPLCTQQVIDGDLGAAQDFCDGLRDQINDLISKNNDLINQLNNLKTEINTAASEMQKIIAKASRVLKRLNGCYGLMQGTRSCAGPGYQAADWDNHNPNGVFDDMETARDELIDLRSDISDEIDAANSRIKSLTDMLADLDCDDKEDANAIQEALDALSKATDAGFKNAAAIKQAALEKIADFNTAYASFKSKIADFLTTTQSVITDNAPNSISNIARSCGMSRRAAARERRRRSKVIRCLKKLKKQFNKLD